MLSLPRLGKFPFLAILSMRGDFGEGNPWQMPMGKSIQPVLEACDVICLKVDDANEVASTVAAAMTMAFQGQESVCVLLGQKMLGAKKF
jgi:sulfopyruvate decarboxylase TPP-binding subunit